LGVSGVLAPPGTLSLGDWLGTAVGSVGRTLRCAGRPVSRRAWQGHATRPGAPRVGFTLREVCIRFAAPRPQPVSETAPQLRSSGHVGVWQRGACLWWVAEPSDRPLPSSGAGRTGGHIGLGAGPRVTWSRPRPDPRPTVGPSGARPHESRPTVSTPEVGHGRSRPLVWVTIAVSRYDVSATRPNGQTDSAETAGDVGLGGLLVGVGEDLAGGVHLDQASRLSGG